MALTQSWAAKKKCLCISISYIVDYGQISQEDN